jgi:hypothetical protein
MEYTLFNINGIDRFAYPLNILSDVYDSIFIKIIIRYL